MKILESQNAVLSNYEVYQHLADHQAAAKQKQRRGPGTLATLVKEVLAYLQTAPSPLAKQEETRRYDADVAARLLEGLGRANLGQDLAKGEVLMLLNLRPSSIAVLSAVVEDMEERFSDDEQAAILDVVAEVLGRDGEGDGNGNGAATEAEEAVESVERQGA